MSDKKSRAKDNKKISVVNKINRHFNLQTFDTVYEVLKRDLNSSKELKQQGFLIYSFTEIIEAIKSQEPQVGDKSKTHNLLGSIAEFVIA